MLIKVQTANHADSFLLIDRVESVRYEGKPREFTDTLELYNHLETLQQIESCRLVLDPALCPDLDPRSGSAGTDFPQNRVGQLSEGRVYRLNSLYYERDGKFQSIAFDAIAYICNDEGKTLERAYACGILNR